MNAEKLKQWFQDGKDAFSAVIAPETLDKEQRTVNVVWFTSIDVARYDYWKDETYLRRFDPKGVDLSLLNSGAPVLDNHWLSSASDQKGRVEKAWVEGKNYLATLRFSRRPEVDGLWQDIEDTIVTKFSMGVEILDSIDLARKEGEPLVKLATKWRPFEISIAPLPADFGTTTLSRAAREEEGACGGLLTGQLRNREIEIARLR